MSLSEGRTWEMLGADALVTDSDAACGVSGATEVSEASGLNVDGDEPASEDGSADGTSEVSGAPGEDSDGLTGGSVGVSGGVGEGGRGSVGGSDGGLGGFGEGLAGLMGSITGTPYK